MPATDKAPVRSTAFADLTPLGVLNAELDRIYELIGSAALIVQRNKLKPLEAVGMSGGAWVRAVADGTVDALGVVVAADDNQFVVGFSGVHKIAGHRRDLGSHYFLSQDTPGLLVTPRPGPGGRVQHVCVPIDADRILVQVEEGIG